MEWGHETDYSDVEFAEEDSAFVWYSLINLVPVNPQPDMARSDCQHDCVHCLWRAAIPGDSCDTTASGDLRNYRAVQAGSQRSGM